MDLLLMHGIVTSCIGHLENTESPPFSPPGRLYLCPNPSLLYPTLWISVCSRWWRTLRELITGWICLPPFHFPLLSFWPPLSPASFFSSLYNSVNISEWSSCGVHIRKWLLASPLSPLLIPECLKQVICVFPQWNQCFERIKYWFFLNQFWGYTNI